MLKRLLITALLAPSLFPTSATSKEAPSAWQIRKCQIYKAAWSDLPILMDTSLLSLQFTTLNETFISSGCLAHIGICPQSKGEIAAANILTIAAMNGGTASSFVPFRC